MRFLAEEEVHQIETGLEVIYNYLYWDKGLSSSGKPTLEQLEAIRDAGFEVLINLLPAKETPQEEENHVRDMGLEYLQIQVWWDSPEISDITQFFEAMERSRGKRVFVHCAANMRATAFLYLYHTLILKQGEEQSRAMMSRIWEPNPIWTLFIERIKDRFSKTK